MLEHLRGPRSQSIERPILFPKTPSHVLLFTLGRAHLQQRSYCLSGLTSIATNIFGIWPCSLVYGNPTEAPVIATPTCRLPGSYKYSSRNQDPCMLLHDLEYAFISDADNI